MCGIAGIMYKYGQGPLGTELLDMLDAIKHRGLDSTGVAIYRQLDGWAAGELLMAVGLEPDADPQAVSESVAELLDELLVIASPPTVKGSILEYRISSPQDLRRMSDSVEALPGVQEILSIGEHLEVIKDLGCASDIDGLYEISAMRSTHGIGHVRLATESCVDRSRAHPFWAYSFKDVAIVHNGQLTNYNNLRRRFEAIGYRFRTDNDSELIAVYMAHYLSTGHEFREILERSRTELDGSYTFLVSSPDGIGYSKDALGAKPLVQIETEDRILVASEEVALRRLIKDEEVQVVEPAPSEVMTWQLH
jgi:methylamine---glutamate N-methyltransferase subunit A